MKPEFYISISALIISVLSLSWNIWSKLFDYKKKLLIKCFKTETCTITITNIGNKPVFVRRIEIEEKIHGKIQKPNIEYQKYSDKFEMNPIIPDTWRTIEVGTTKSFTLYDANRKYKKTRILVIEASGKKHKTKWFKQNNFK